MLKHIDIWPYFVRGKQCLNATGGELVGFLLAQLAQQMT